MSAHVSVADLFGVLLPRDHPNGWLGMISAYLDDSGTHDQSEIVVVGGIVGTEGRLDALDRNWKKHLDRPLCGAKPPLERFHMVDCQNSIGEFAGWTRTETDYFCHQLITEIIDSDVWGYGVACARKDWDELVNDTLRAVWGDAEGLCIRNCFVRMVAWAQTHTFDPKMTFVFDERPRRTKRDAKVVFDAFEKSVLPPPSLVGIAFLSSYDIRLLQAADMIAWELYQHANDLLLGGSKTPKRPALGRLAKGINFDGQIAKREDIEKIVAFAKSRDQDALRQIADHFTSFDPENPDYSYLSGKPPS